MTASTHRRILTAIARLDSAERHLLFKRKNNYFSAWSKQCTLFDIRNARTLLKNINLQETKKPEIREMINSLHSALRTLESKGDTHVR